MPSRRLGLLLAMLSLASLVAFPSPAAAIYGGEVAESGDYPAMALLIKEEGASAAPICGGVLVGATKVVTAAYCATEGPDYVMLGEATLSDVDLDPPADESQFYEVVDADIHPGYAEGEFDRAVAVLTLAPNNPAQAAPVLVARPSQSALWSDAKSTTTAGWGITSAGQDGFSDQLHDVTLPILSDVDCNTVGITVGCAGGRGPMICAGNGGGPAMVDNANGDPVLVGIMVFTDTECGDDGLSYFTRVGQDPVHSWLKIQLDVLAPRVSTATPTGTGVDRDVNVKAVFSEVMRPATLNRTTFKLFRIGADGDAHRVENVTVTPRADGKAATLNPARRLAERTRYKAVVTTGAQDLARLGLDQDRQQAGNQPKSWFFKTGAN